MKRIKELLGQGKLVKVFGLGQLCYPKIIEILGFHGGYDAVWLDQEHAGISTAQIEEATRAARSVGLDSFVRLAPTDYASVMRPLEAGAGGVMAAQVRTAAQAAEVVNWAKFYPDGLRGVNSGGIDGRYGTMPLREYMPLMNQETFVAIQIEHAQAVAEIDQIASLKNVDVLFIGPADLAQSMGLPGEYASHPKVWQAIERVAEAARKHKVHWAILPPNMEVAKRCFDLGCRMLSLGMDIWGVHRGIKAFKEEYAELMRL